MPAITLATAQAHLDAWLACDLALSQNQSYRIGERTYTRADAGVVQSKVEYWSAKVDSLTATPAGRRGPRVFGVRLG